MISISCRNNGVTKEFQEGITLQEAAITTVGNRVFHPDFCLGKDLYRSLVEKETQGAVIYPHTAGVTYIDKFYVTIVVYAETQAL